LKNAGPIRHCEPPHAHSPGVATGTVARRLRIDVHDNNDNDDNDNAWQRGPLWPHGMGPITGDRKNWPVPLDLIEVLAIETHNVHMTKHLQLTNIPLDQHTD